MLVGSRYVIAAIEGCCFYCPLCISVVIGISNCAHGIVVYASLYINQLFQTMKSGLKSSDVSLMENCFCLWKIWTKYGREMMRNFVGIKFLIVL